MAKKDDVTRLLTNMKGSAQGARAPQQTKGKGDSLKRHLNLSHYKENHAWPGRAYLLVGNSYYLENGLHNSKNARRRKACIAMRLEHGRKNRSCLSVAEALLMDGFRECLSRFEYDWLRREDESTLLGPAYDEKGKLLPGSFAVWRRDPAYKNAAEKELVASK